MGTQARNSQTIPHPAKRQCNPSTPRARVPTTSSSHRYAHICSQYKPTINQSPAAAARTLRRAHGSHTLCDCAGRQFNVRRRHSQQNYFAYEQVTYKTRIHIEHTRAPLLQCKRNSHTTSSVFLLDIHTHTRVSLKFSARPSATICSAAASSRQSSFPGALAFPVRVIDEG